MKFFFAVSTLVFVSDLSVILQLTTETNIFIKTIAKYIYLSLGVTVSRPLFYLTTIQFMVVFPPFFMGRPETLNFCGDDRLL